MEKSLQLRVSPEQLQPLTGCGIEVATGGDVGRNVGLAVGRGVDVDVGRGVGVNLGVNVGPLVAVALGVWVGSCVAVLVGVAGIFVGIGVASCSSSAVAKGCTVAVSETATVGTFVGC